MSIYRSLISGVFAYGAGCAGTAGDDLIENDRWDYHDEVTDPFVEHRPETVDCNPLGVTNESGVLEVQTDVCKYASLKQGALLNIPSGTLVELLVYHSALFAIEPAQGHVAVMSGDQLLMERWIEIPGEADVYALELQLEEPISMDETVTFHVHNHGANSWKLAHIRTTD